METQLAKKDEVLDAPGAALKIDESVLNIVKAPSLGSVLPVQFYTGAGTLTMTEEQTELLAQHEDCPDENIDVRPDGLIYAGHTWYRRLLLKLFGAGGWAIVPASDVVHEPGTPYIYRTWVLIVRGEDFMQHYVGEAVGWAAWYENNPRANKADAVETTKSDALSKIVSKSFGCGLNMWEKQFSRRWRNENCLKVKVRTNKGIEDWWRRKDEEPYDNEIPEPPNPVVRRTAPAPAPISRKAAQRHTPEAAYSVADVTDAPVQPPPQAPAEAAVIPPSKPPSSEAPPAAPLDISGSTVSESQLRMFLARCRAKKLVDGDDAGKALSLVCEVTGKTPSGRGKTSSEVLISVVRECDQRQFVAVMQAVSRYRGEK